MKTAPFKRKSEFHYFKGKCKWARVHTPDVEYNTWSIQLYLTPESWEDFNKLKEPKGETDGIMNEVHKDEDGEYIRLRRPMTRVWQGRETLLTPPIVLDKDNQVTKEEIGNGSDVTVKVECYTYRKRMGKGFGRAIRLEAVKVDVLVPRVNLDQLDDREKKQVSGLPEQPAPVFWE